MSKPHKHAKIIKAWADGAEIEYRSTGFTEWFECPEPKWFIDFQYRVKPQPKIVKMYMHYEQVEERIRNEKNINNHNFPHLMYDNNRHMSNHLEFTFTDGKLTSVEIKR
jgi:hypothetical protein